MHQNIWAMRLKAFPTRLLALKIVVVVDVIWNGEHLFGVRLHQMAECIITIRESGFYPNHLHNSPTTFY